MRLSNFDWVTLIIDDPELSFSAKAFGMYFSTFMNKDQDCAWPSYRRICADLHCTPKTVKKYITELENCEYLIIGKVSVLGKGHGQELNKYTANIPTKALSNGKQLIEKVLPNRQKVLPTGSKGTSQRTQKVLPTGYHNNTYNHPLNNQKNNTLGKTTKNNKKFKKPTLEEIKAYCESRSNRVDYVKFFNHYESNGWKVGKNPMKNWKAAVHTWEQNDKTNQNQANVRTC